MCTEGEDGGQDCSCRLSWYSCKCLHINSACKSAVPSALCTQSDNPSLRCKILMWITAACQNPSGTPVESTTLFPKAGSMMLNSQTTCLSDLSIPDPSAAQECKRAGRTGAHLRKHGLGKCLYTHMRRTEDIGCLPLLLCLVPSDDLPWNLRLEKFLLGCWLARDLRICSSLPMLGLQEHAPMPGFFRWVLRI